VGIENDTLITTAPSFPLPNCHLVYGHFVAAAHDITNSIDQNSYKSEICMSNID
jgi:hypothetical protein